MAENLKINKVIPVFIAWTNEDRTEGRRREFPFAVCMSETTAKRLGKGKYVQGTDCPVFPDKVLMVDGQTYVPGYVIPPHESDQKIDQKNKDIEVALAKAKKAGLTDDEIKLLTGIKNETLNKGKYHG